MDQASPQGPSDHSQLVLRPQVSSFGSGLVFWYQRPSPVCLNWRGCHMTSAGLSFLIRCAAYPKHLQKVLLQRVRSVSDYYEKRRHTGAFVPLPRPFDHKLHIIPNI